jgi:hypothetical protein
MNKMINGELPLTFDATKIPDCHSLEAFLEKYPMSLDVSPKNKWRHFKVVDYTITCKCGKSIPNIQLYGYEQHSYNNGYCYVGVVE